jgi:hypothetical protein
MKEMMAKAKAEKAASLKEKQDGTYKYDITQEDKKFVAGVKETAE